MNRIRVFIGLLLIIPLFCASLALAGPLDPYLLHPTDVPAACRQVPGLFPVHEKVTLFYDYKAYRISLPKVIERHAQSFDCGGQKGTFYFFAYADSSQAESAELFATPVLTHQSPVPLIRSFAKGFVIVSFREPPASLLDALDKKLKPSHPQTVAPVQKSTVTTTTITTAPVAAAPKVSTVTVAAVPIPPSMPVGTIAISPPVPVASPPPAMPEKQLPVSGPELSDDVINTILSELGCAHSDAMVETREVCGWVQRFLTGSVIHPVIAAEDLRIGVAYHINSFGQLDARYYDVLIGSGRPGEVTLFPIHPSDGLEDEEARRLIAGRQIIGPHPSNGLAERLARHGRPMRPILFPTGGLSHVMRFAGDKQIFIRNSGSQWILISVTGKLPSQQTRSDIVIAGLY